MFIQIKVLKYFETCLEIYFCNIFNIHEHLRIFNAWLEFSSLETWKKWGGACLKNEAPTKNGYFTFWNVTFNANENLHYRRCLENIGKKFLLAFYLHREALINCHRLKMSYA